MATIWDEGTNRRDLSSSIGVCRKKIPTVATIVCSITNDIVYRVTPIYEFLQNYYESVRIVLYDGMGCGLSYQHIVLNFEQLGYKIDIINSISGGVEIQKLYPNSVYYYLIKHSHISSSHFTLYYLFLINDAIQKYYLLSYLPHIKNATIRRIELGTWWQTRKTMLKNGLIHYALRLAGNLTRLLLPIVMSNYKKKPIVTEPQEVCEPNTILFVRLDHLGDIVCTLPSMQAIRRVYPNSKLTFLCGSWSSQILSANAHLYDELIIWDAPWCDKTKSIIKKKFCMNDFRNFIKTIRMRKFDLVIQPRGEEMNVLLAACSGARQVVSGINTNHSLLNSLREYIEIPVVYNHYKTYNISAWPKHCLEKINIIISRLDIENSVTLLPPPDNLTVEMEIWKQQGYSICCLMIGSGSLLRQWPPERFSELITKLFNNKIISILIGARDELLTRDKIFMEIDKPVIDLVNKVNFTELASVIKASDFLITLDTSIMHLGSLLNKRIIALFGAGNIDLAKPTFSEYRLIKRELGCSGCADSCPFVGSERYAPCMCGITVDDVLSAAMEYAENSGLNG